MTSSSVRETFVNSVTYLIDSLSGSDLNYYLTECLLMGQSSSVSMRVNSLTKFLRTFTSVSLEMSFTFPPVNLASCSSFSFPAASVLAALEALDSN